MPLIIPAELPAYEALAKETVFVMRRERAQSQKIRPLRILILNLMPTKVVTETQLARLFANSPIQMHLTFLQTATYSSTTPQEHMRAFYKTFDAVRHERYGGMVITGAPLEDMAYERVDYWGELCSIMDYSKTNVYSTLHLCWGALAGLYYHFGVRKVHLPQKLFGVFEHRVLRPSTPLVRGFDERFYAPTAAGPGWMGRTCPLAQTCGCWQTAARPAPPALHRPSKTKQAVILAHDSLFCLGWGGFNPAASPTHAPPVRESAGIPRSAPPGGRSWTPPGSR